MNLGDLTNFVEKPLAAVSNIVNTPNSAGRYRPFYLRNLLDAVQGRNLNDAVKGKVVLITGGSSGTVRRPRRKLPRPAARWCWSHAPWKTSRTSPTTYGRSEATVGPPTSTRAIYPTWMRLP